ncbi:MAG TPA: oligopeptide transporter, OPT family [Gammaproteobacteria bacterium]|nr:oligopeptide transporter, OPT family [Gammaproteobacteria bacterium]
MTGAPAPLPQLTIKATVLGLVLSALLAGANAYLGMFAGLTVSASIPSAVISMAVLRLWRNSNILENNMVQSIASSGEAIAAGVIFTFPALILLNHWQAFDYWWVTIIAGVGGLLGVLFTIPLRRSLIVEQQLVFPEGTATVEVLKVGDAPTRGAAYLALAAGIGASIKIGETGLRLWSGTAQAAGYVGKSTIAYVGTNLSPALLGIGYIVGLNISALLFVGGALAWFVAIPIYSTWFLPGDPALAAQQAAGVPAADLAGAIWSTKIRYLGVGAMLISGISTLFSLRSSLAAGIRGGLAATRRQGGAVVDHRERDMPMRLVLICIVLFVIPIYFLYHAIVGTVGVALALTGVMVLAAFLFAAVGGYLAGVIGSSNSPISGITMATILLTSLLLLGLMGGDAPTAPAAAILVGAVVCCAASIGGDNLQVLKTGYLLGATPWRQQLGQSLGVLSAVLFMAPILNLLLNAYGIGARTPEHPNALLAPQANLMASVAQGVLRGGLPWNMIAAGVVIGGLFVALDVYLQRSGARWRSPALAVASGIYLPLELSVPILAGGVVAFLAARHAPRAADAQAGHGQLFAAGLITGEAMVGILMAIPIYVSGDPEVFALPFQVPGAVALLIVAAVAVLLYRIAVAGARR